MMNQFIVLLKELNPKDATGNFAISLVDLLRQAGQKAYISAEINNTQLNDVLPITKIPNDAIILHQMTGDLDFLETSLKISKFNILTYHNISPYKYYFNFDFNLALNLKKSRENLKKYRKKFFMCLTVSEYNRLELESWGFNNVEVLPIFLDLDKQNQIPKVQIENFDKNCKNILSVGSLMPHKKHEDTIKAFFLYHKYLNTDSHLYLVGKSGPAKYVEILKNLVDRFGIKDFVHFQAQVSDEDLDFYYQNSDLYIHMSEHEGFCVPLIEALSHQLPILAYAQAGVPYTLEKSGILFKNKNFAQIAELIDEILENEDLRQSTIDAQNKRLEYFSKDNALDRLKEIMNKIETLNL